jgi:hypothetical protein
MSNALTFSHNTKNNRVYLVTNRENIWITRPSDKQLETLQNKTLEDIQVVRFKSESRTLYYIKCEDYNSMVSAPQAASILTAQGRIDADALAKLKTPADFEKLANIHTVQQVPYWIDTINDDGTPALTGWSAVKFKEHYVAKFNSRAAAQRAIKMLNELGQPTVEFGAMKFQNSAFTLKTLNWYDLNPNTKTDFMRLLDGTLPRTQFENACAALVRYTPLLPVPTGNTALTSAPARTKRAAKAAKASASKPVAAKAGKTAKAASPKASKVKSVSTKPAPKKSVKK